MNRRRFHWLVYYNIPAALFIGVWLPLRMVFVGEIQWLDILTDVSMLVLILVRFIKRDSTFTERRSPEKKSNFRRRTSLVVDILAALPLVSVCELIFGGSFAYLFVFKLLCLRRIYDVRKVLDTYDSLHLVIARLVPMALVMPLVVHLLATGWVALGSGTAGPHEDKYFEYGRAVYWTITTLATVGYGDIAGKTLPQMFYSNLTMIVGVAFFGYVLSNVASLLARLDSARQEYLSLLDKVEVFMRYNELPVDIRSKVRSYYRYLWESRKGYDDSFILSNLPTKLRAEVSLHLNAEIIEKVPLLKGADQDLLQDIVLQLKPLVVVPGEKIFHFGEPGEAMYFIHRGPVEIVAQDGKILATLQPGSFFGEMALLTTNPRSATARACDYCDLFILSREAFDRVLHRYPDFEKHVQEIADQRSGAESSLNAQTG